MDPTQEHLNRFYLLLQQLHNATGSRMLADCNHNSGWPSRGVYFFFEPGETRPTGELRVVRVGTHAVSDGSKATLWQRLSQHKGASKTGGGNHRGSIFRRHVGSALLNAGRILPPTGSAWGQGSNAPKPIREAELPIERAVSEYIRAMPMLWIEADDEPSKHSIRAQIERHSIALLSQTYEGSAYEPSSADWLGQHATNAVVSSSGLWNVRAVGNRYDPEFLDLLEQAIKRTVQR